MTEEILTSLLGLSGPQALALKVGATLVTDLLRHPQPETPRVAGVLSSTPGRLRLRVAGMKRAADLARRVEDRLTALPGVREVKASPVTGTVLVTFDESAITARAVQRAAEWATAAIRVVQPDADYRLPRVEPVLA